MASDDVIELGSSDEDTEPAPKKKKPPLNAMVHIPNKLTEVTIRPTKSSNKINPVSIIRGSIGKSVTVTKVPKNNINPYAKKFSGKLVKGAPCVKQVNVPVQNIGLPIMNNIGSVPLLNSSLIQTSGKTRLIQTGKNYTSNIKVNNRNNAPVNPLNIIRIMKPATPMNATNPVGTRLKKISKLPPGITVKRTTVGSIKPLPIIRMTKPATTTSREVLTVDLDDEEPTTSSAPAHQWYLKPEEPEKTPQKAQGNPSDSSEDKSPENKSKKSHSKGNISVKSAVAEQKQSPDKSLDKSPLAVPEPSDLEQQNNKEPDKDSFIEITIDDSPIKPPQSKIGFKVGAELAIMIEDSPVKGTTDNTVPSIGSDDEKDVHRKEPNSKKKLEYPKNIEMIETLEIEFQPVEIEFDPLPAEKLANKNQEIIKKPNRVVEVMDVVEIEESPDKPQEIVQSTTPKKNRPEKPICKMTVIETLVIDDQEKDEFHPIYQTFINLCFQLENSEDMKKIVEKKIKAYYRQVPKDYTESETFIDMVSSKIMAIKASPEKMYLFIKDVVDELNLQRKLAKAQPLQKETKNEEQEKFLYGKESEFDSKRQRQIRKLEKTLKKLHRAIQKLEEQEVDFDDEEDSVYLLTDSEDDSSSKDGKPQKKEALLQRYKERMVRVHAKLCQLTNTKMPSEARVQIDARPGQPKGPAKRLEKWINRKVPIGTPLPFPDFHNVLSCVRDANHEDKLGWNEADIMDEARDLFTRCGKKLQRRRQENEWRLAASRLPADVVDPAEDSPELKKKLEENTQVAAKKESEVFNKFADRQNQLRLEAVEIGDKEAEESPVESDDEETADDNASLVSKEKRKECLKRLLQGKSNKTSDEKENQPKVQADESSRNKEIAIKDSSEAKNSTRETGKPVETSNEIENITNETDKPVDTSNEAKHSKNDTHKQVDTEDKDSLESTLPKETTSTNNKTVESNSDSSQDNKQNDEKSSLSDDIDKVDSDIDELHLLRKYYSENEMNTSVIDSDSGTPIAISDTSSINDILSSDEAANKGRSSDVISIENSSYSESEEKKDDSSKYIETDCTRLPRAVSHEDLQSASLIDANIEIQCSQDGVEKKTNKNINKYNQSLEDILLASSDEADDTEARKDKEQTNTDKDTYINLRDDSISIGETVIGESQSLGNSSDVELKSDQSDKNANKDLEEGMDICQTTIPSEEHTGIEVNMGEKTVVETTSIKLIEAVNDENASVNTGVKSIESIEDENISEITSTKSGNTNDYDNVSETKGVTSGETNDSLYFTNEYVETIADANGSETKGFKSAEQIKDTLINNNIKNGDSSINMNEIPMDIMENTDADNESKAVEKTKENIPQPMEVDSII